MMIELVISGGQTGADQAGWRAAKAAGIPTGGWMPNGFKTEDGLRPEFAELYGAKEHVESGYAWRTEENIVMSDMSMLFGDDTSTGSRHLLKIERQIRDGLRAAPIRIPNRDRCPVKTAKLLRLIDPRILNVAGNRESSAPGIGAWVEKYLIEVFQILAESNL